jgi:hypothetical protein
MRYACTINIVSDVAITFIFYHELCFLSKMLTHIFLKQHDNAISEPLHC